MLAGREAASIFCQQLGQVRQDGHIVDHGNLKESVGTFGTQEYLKEWSCNNRLKVGKHIFLNNSQIKKKIIEKNSGTPSQKKMFDQTNKLKILNFNTPPHKKKHKLIGGDKATN